MVTASDSPYAEISVLVICFIIMFIEGTDESQFIKKICANVLLFKEPANTFDDLSFSKVLLVMICSTGKQQSWAQQIAHMLVVCF